VPPLLVWRLQFRSRQVSLRRVLVVRACSLAALGEISPLASFFPACLPLPASAQPSFGCCRVPASGLGRIGGDLALASFSPFACFSLLRWGGLLVAQWLPVLGRTGGDLAVASFSPFARSASLRPHQRCGHLCFGALGVILPWLVSLLLLPLPSCARYLWFQEFAAGAFASPLCLSALPSPVSLLMGFGPVITVFDPHCPCAGSSFFAAHR
jgi:hypothetical protein